MGESPRTISRDWLITTIVKKAVTKIATMFNPVGAIVQAILAIVDVVMFVIEKANQILEFITAVVESISAIAMGQIQGAANWIEKSLANMIPLLIGFLAQLLGLGGISKKIKETILKIQNAVDKAIDKAIAKIVAVVKKLLGGGKEKDGKDEKEKPELQAGLAALDQLTAKYDKEPESKQDFEGDVAKVKSDHKVFKKLSVQEKGDEYVYDYEASPGKSKSGPHNARKKVKLYEDILTKLKLPLIKKEKDPDEYRKKMRVAIVNAYKGKAVSTLNREVFRSDAIPAPQNRIRGDIFELWLQENGIMERQSPIFTDDKYKELHKTRIADGIRGKKLVDAKVRRPDVKPSPNDKKQMEDYQHIISNGRKALNQSDTVEKGPFTAVIYIFSDKKLIPLWQPDLNKKIPGNHEVE